MNLKHIPLKYKFWAVNGVMFAGLLLLVLAALAIEQQAINAERKGFAAGVVTTGLLAETTPARLRWIDSLSLANLPVASDQPRWLDADFLDALPTGTDLSGAWIVLQGGQPAVLGVEQQTYLTLLLSRAPLYAGVVFVLMVVVLCVSQLLIVFITRNILALRDVMVAVQDSGDLTLRAPVKSEDEVGSMAVAFNAMLTAQQTVVGSVREAAAELEHSAGELAQLMGDVKVGTRAQQSQTDMVAAAVNEMSATVQDIASHTTSARDQSRQANSLAQQGRDQTRCVQRTITGLSAGIERCTAHMQTLAGHSQEINGVVSEIRAIAEQTNLLALNAAIEAARAGDSGRGFAVVADEVRTLAQRVQNSTADIQQRIEALREGTVLAVEDMEASAELTHNSVEQAEWAGASLEDIAAAVNQITEGNGEIAAALDQQSQVADSITRSIIEIRDVTEHTAEKTLRSAATSEQLAALAHQLNQAVSSLRA